ncbi:MAG TPA: hypothetical protein DDW30_04030 [Clostridiales bacterium]|nr:hypothetical protein [Clostridiales bacterium]
MGLFKLFRKDKKKNEQASSAEPVTPEVKKEEPVAQPPEAVAAEAPKTAPAAPEKAAEKAPEKTAEKTAAKPAAKKPTAAKPAAKAPAKSTSAGTTVPKKPTAAPAAMKTTAAPKASAAKPAASKAPAAVRTSSTPVRQVGRPFFVTTEEDIRIAFDEAIAAAEAEIAANGAKAVGKYEFNLEVDGYHFYLIANNGQVLFDSPSFTTLLGALNGIKTFKKTVANTEFAIKKDKYGRFRFILANKYYGENYSTKDQCLKCAESVKNFANNSRITRYKPDSESIAAFEAAKSTKRTPDSLNWEQIAKAEAAAVKMGKFEIAKEEDGEYSFYLLANNGQILYSSRYYASEVACRKGVESFKRAAYVGNFFVDRDKFGNYRYVLKNIGSAPSFIGESYDNKPQCEKVIDSVKNFIVTATIEVEGAETSEN